MKTNMQNTFQTKVVYAFNNFYLNFLTDLKSYNDDLRKEVKKNFKVFDRASTTYFETIKESFGTNENLFEVVLLPGLSYDDLAKRVGENELDVLKSYVYIFKALVSIYEDDDETLLEKVLEIVKAIQHDDVPEGDVRDKIKDILDDDLSGVLSELLVLMRKNTTTEGQRPSGSGVPPVGDNMFSMLENSKIGSLAKEISSEINIGDLNIENPEQLLNFSNLSSSNNALGSIISKVSTKIQEKIERGDISQTELVNEALSLVGMMNQGQGGGNSLFNNPMFADLLQNLNGMNMGGAQGAGTSGTRVQVDKNKLQRMDTRDRLREKLEKRRKDKKQDK